MSLTKRNLEQQTASDARRTTPGQVIARQLESVRCRVRFALCAADEGDPSFATLEDISRALVAATSELERIAVEVETLLNLERISAHV
jgi:hypothetical protein